MFILGEGQCHQPCLLHVLSSLHTVFPDGEEAGRGGPPGAAEPSDWQGESDDPGLMGKSLPELWWCWGGHSCQVSISLLYSHDFFFFFLKVWMLFHCREETKVRRAVCYWQGILFWDFSTILLSSSHLFSLLQLYQVLPNLISVILLHLLEPES